MFSSVQSLSHVRPFATSWTAAWQASLSINNSWSLLKLMSIELLMPSNHLILCRPLLLLPSFLPSFRVFSSEFFTSGDQRIRVSVSASVLPMNIQDWFQIRMDWLNLLAVQRTLKSLFQHCSPKVSVLWCYGFSNSHVWMWELDYKESWVSKNWCFWTVVLEKAPKRSLDFK